ncbi:hypothetical protein JFP838_pA0059 (plasmid) [Clostridium perfringens]|uniref:Uncharacterized protein n=2 Tax=Clostridium perfringens TaxID=1502 RepID=A0A140GR16_CLOPF|nr:hypothetical protein JFP838_pA0059 [Clostridium perfringens]
MYNIEINRKGVEGVALCRLKYMVLIDDVIKKYDKYNRDFNNLLNFQNNLNMENYNYDELKKLHDYIIGLDCTDSLLKDLIVTVKFWMNVKRGAINYPMINKYEFLSMNEKRIVDDYLHNNPIGILDFTFIKEHEALLLALKKDKIIRLYRTKAICPKCSSSIDLYENKFKCPLCESIYSKKELLSKEEYILNRK